MIDAEVEPRRAPPKEPRGLPLVLGLAGLPLGLGVVAWLLFFRG